MRVYLREYVSMHVRTITRGPSTHAHVRFRSIPECSVRLLVLMFAKDPGKSDTVPKPQNLIFGRKFW